MVADLYVWWLLIWLLFSFVCLWVGLTIVFDFLVLICLIWTSIVVFEYRLLDVMCS